MKKGILIGWMICSLMLVPGAVWSQDAKVPIPYGQMAGGKIQVGKMKVIPELTVFEVYDDNIYLGNGTNQLNEQEESDWLTEIRPGLTFDYGIPGRGNIQFGYSGVLMYYADDDQNDWQNHSGFLNVRYKAPSGVMFQLAERYTDAEDPFGSPDQFALGRPKTQRWNNDLKTALGYEFSRRFRVIGRYNYYKQNYELEVDSTQDYDIQEFGAGLQMLVMPKTWAFLRYFYGEQDYFTHPVGSGLTDQNDADRDWSEVMAGLTWDTGAKLSGEVGFGYSWYDFENDRDLFGNQYDANDTWVARTNVQYNMRETTKLNFGIIRAVRTTGATSTESFEDTLFRAGIVQGLTHKIFAKADVSYSLNDYNLPLADPREDDNYNANISLEYLVQEWIKAGLGYGWMKKESNYDANDFTRNRVWVFLRAKY